MNLKNQHLIQPSTCFFSYLCTLLLLLLVPPIQGQTLLDSLISPNEETGGGFGNSVAGVGGDVNADGVADVIVGAYWEDPGSSPTNAGRAYIMSGADGSVLDTLVSPNEEGYGLFGWSVAGIGGDVNADGVADVIVGALEGPGSSPTNAGRAYIMSGADGSVLDTLYSPNEENDGRFGWSVAGIGGDVNADGVADVIVGAHWEAPGSSPDDAGRAYIMSGADGSVLDTLESPNEERFGEFGLSVAGVGGDVNADGVADVIVGAKGEGPGSSPNDAGRAYIMSGANGSILHTLASPNEDGSGRFGVSVAGVGGDVNADGVLDVIVGAYWEAPGSSPDLAGRAYIMSGADGSGLYNLVSPNEERFGEFGLSVAGVGGDVNADGVADVIVGAIGEDPGSSPNDAGRAYIYYPCPTRIQLSDTLCQGDSLFFANNWIGSSGVFIDTISVANACDSVVTLDLTIDTVNTLVSLTGATLTADAANAGYQWLNCAANYALVQGATARSFTPATNGDYAVEVTDNGCQDTSDCVTVTTIGMEDLVNGNLIALYPNPTKGSFTLDLGSLRQATVRILSIDGRLIMQKENLPGGQHHFSLRKQSDGLYFVEVLAQEDMKVLKVVKE